MQKHEAKIVLNGLKNKTIKLKEDIIHSCSSIQPFADCEGILLGYDYGETWETITCLVRITDKFGRQEPIWINYLDICGF